MMPQEYKSNNQGPQIEDITDLNDTFYQALPEDKKQAYKEVRLEELAKDIDETAAKVVEDIEKTDFYTQLDPPTQAATKEKSKYLVIQQKLKNMRESNIKGWGTKDVNALREPRYPQNKLYILCLILTLSHP